METQTASEEITFSLRIPNDLNERICAEAEKEMRSRQAQIVYTLEKLFEKTPNANGKKEKTK